MRRCLALVVWLAMLGAPSMAAAPDAAGGGGLPAPTVRRDAGASDATGISRPEIRTATAALAVAGYAPGPVDGDWGAADAAALAVYQSDWDLHGTGALTPDLVLRLTRDHPETQAHWVETDRGCRVWNRFPQARETVTWTGKCVDGATSGTGRLTWVSLLRGRLQVETYTGERREGRENGLGLYRAADGSRYAGGWRDGLKDGQGTDLSPEGHVYVGGYRDGRREGWGIYARAEGSSYSGQWLGGVQDGVGIARWRDGSHYEGQLRDGKPQGAGTLTFANGTVYSGDWHAGCLAEATRGATAGVTQADCGWR